jgi:DNA helicase-2/ATP-dependent DNA helicase PcrA
MPLLVTTSVFDDYYAKLNTAQKLAVDTIEGPVMVVAGPGTGKTQILTLRIANILMQTQINPENILALTFTESGVLAMRKRLVQIIGTPGYRAQIHTFHSFCNDVIRQNPEDFENLISSESITEVEQIQILEEIVQTTKLALLKPFGDPLYYVKHLLSAISDLKKEGITPTKLKKAIDDQEKDFGKIEDLYHEKGAYGPKVRDDGTVTKGAMKGKYQDLQKDIAKNKELLIVFEKYQQSLRDKKQYDFNDMLLEVIAAFESNPDLLLRQQEYFQYILVDEHQDTNAAQNKIVELLCSYYEEPNLFVVGDEKQAIYRFQGASLENFLYFK